MTDPVTKIKFSSNSSQPPLNATRAYVMWTKSNHAITVAFPDVAKYSFHKKLMLYGAQKFWESTWFERYMTIKLIGEPEQLVNQCWASLIKYHLDILWPKLDDDNDQIMAQLTAIHQATNRIRGTKFHGLGLAIECKNPNCIEGFIDLYRDITATSNITSWTKDRFLTK